MAKGFEANRYHQEALARLGKPLARRAGSRCELCEAGGIPLAPFEVPPAPEEPDLDHTIFACEECSRGLSRPDRLAPAPRWRPLAETAWSGVPAVQVCAVRLLRALASKGESWAADALDQLQLEPEIEAWIND